MIGAIRGTIHLLVRAGPVAAVVAIAVPTGVAVAGYNNRADLHAAASSAIPCKVVAQTPVRALNGKVYARGYIRCTRKTDGGASVQLQEFTHGRWVNTLAATEDGFKAKPGETVHLRGPVGFRHPGKVRTQLRITLQPANHPEVNVTQNSASVTFS